MLNMESPQMYDAVQTLAQLDLKKQPTPQQATIGQITLTAMSSAQQQQQHQQQQQQQPGTDANNNAQDTALLVKQHAMHQMQHAAAALNNNNNVSALNANNLLQKQQQMLQQYSTQTDLDELTTQEITLDLQHLIDDQFRDPETLGIFSDMVTSPGGLSATLPPNGMVSQVAAKVLQQQTLAARSQQNGYGRGTLAYMPQAVHSNATYNNSSDENSSVGSDSSTIKEEPIDPEYRRHLQETSQATNAVAAAAFMSNGNGLYNAYQSNGMSNGNNNSGNNSNNSMNGGGQVNGNSNGNSNQFTQLTTANVLAHHNLPHLAAQSAAHNLLKHHSKLQQQQRKHSVKHVDKGTEEYRRRRERNNIAVRKSREKAKVRSREVEERVKSLLKEKDTLLRQLQEMTNELQLHKQIYMQLMNHTNPEVSRVCRSFLNTNEHAL
ncbi:CCAAT/enhancer-binding protein [Scaptodrosophila lebanonensis]|uniref:CCAAT/enhancer-binding protein n=1 Tax=Drosophila lebanonensis TaxID=7225 RepID=A0A6J2UJC0_DROLE|nr:CCAAT/enhancer-binding protein [Scaptodrosophila lebanonensis]